MDERVKSLHGGSSLQGFVPYDAPPDLSYFHYQANYLRNSRAIGVLWAVFTACYAIINVVIFVQPQWVHLLSREQPVTQRRIERDRDDTSHDFIIRATDTLWFSRADPAGWCCVDDDDGFMMQRYRGSKLICFKSRERWSGREARGQVYRELTREQVSLIVLGGNWKIARLQSSNEMERFQWSELSE